MLFQNAFYVIDVAFDLHLVPDMGDFAVLIDEESGAFDAHKFLAVHGFFLPYAIGFAHIAVFIRGEREVQALFGLEVIVLFYAAF